MPRSRRYQCSGCPMTARQLDLTAHSGLNQAQQDTSRRAYRTSRAANMVNPGRTSALERADVFVERVTRVGALLTTRESAVLWLLYCFGCAHAGNLSRSIFPTTPHGCIALLLQCSFHHLACIDA